MWMGGDMFVPTNFGTGQMFQILPSNGNWYGYPVFNFSSSWSGTYDHPTIRDSSGNLYGVSLGGGPNGPNAGFVYELSHGGNIWTGQIIWTFGAGTDGVTPLGKLTIDATGNLYGTTAAGGANGQGTVFELSQAGGVWTEKVLHSFGASWADGEEPITGVRMDSSGNLLGTTAAGGFYGAGSVFKLVPSNGAWTEYSLYSFSGGNDGGTPGSLIEDSSGDLFGTTYWGGANQEGVVFEITSLGERVLHAFGSGGDGSNPTGDLTFACAATWRSGCLKVNYSVVYGATAFGGAYGFGTAFRLTQASNVWSEAVLHSFGSSEDGRFPYGGVVLDPSGANYLYGTTSNGGANGSGAIYEIKD
jgi:uncharacterized repeat protein (TIGR03803 family)